MTDVVQALVKRGFAAEAVATPAEAVERIRKLAAGARTVGFGGSLTLKQIGAAEALEADGKELLRHGTPGLSPAEKAAVMKRQQTCDLFLLSANAVTSDGRIVNIDGNGNRVAASIYGPSQVVFVVGRNKIVQGGLDAAVERIKRAACGPNCRRLGKHTPCALNDTCADCDSPDRICKVLVVMERRPTSTPMTVLMVDSALGM